MQPNNSTMEIYIRYEEYLTASQLRQLLKELDRMYEALYCGLAHCDPRDIGLQSQLRVSEVRTGDSITLLLAEGVRTVADSDAVIHIPVAVGALSVAALVLVSAAKGIVQLRKTWHEGTKAKYEGRKARHEAEALERSRIADEADAQRRDQVQPLSEHTRFVATDAATTIINLVEYSPNITCLRVNGESVVE